jgi:hypothetical protein
MFSFQEKIRVLYEIEVLLLLESGHIFGHPKKESKTFNLGWR